MIRHPATRYALLTIVASACAAWAASAGVEAGPGVRAQDVRKILFLGNSLTHHGPKADVDWQGDWGMAASAPEKDYVHLVAAGMAERTGTAPEIRFRNIAEFERRYATFDVEAELKDLFAFEADMVVLAIGENVPGLASEEAGEAFKAGVARILACARSSKGPILLVRSCFWADEAKDRRLREAAAEAGAVYIDAGPLGRVEANAARSERPFKHAGVGDHPGDRGMKALADLILKAVPGGGDAEGR